MDIYISRRWLSIEPIVPAWQGWRNILTLPCLLYCIGSISIVLCYSTPSLYATHFCNNYSALVTTFFPPYVTLVYTFWGIWHYAFCLAWFGILPRFQDSCLDPRYSCLPNRDTVWLQISVRQYFREFQWCLAHHENIDLENFSTPCMERAMRQK